MAEIKIVITDVISLGKSQTLKITTEPAELELMSGQDLVNAGLSGAQCLGVHIMRYLREKSKTGELARMTVMAPRPKPVQ
mgnify:CR=1 FL=1